MEESSSFESKKWPVENKGSHASVRNGLCDLPDEILHRIVSCLPMRDAVRTGVLSKRWRWVWSCCPGFVLNQLDFPTRSGFFDFVGRVLTTGDGHSLEALCLTCWVHSDADLVGEWIDLAVGRNVQKLWLDLREPEEPAVLPSSLFESRTLTELSLRIHYLIKIPVLPPSVRFESLKVLTLEGVEFLDEELAGRMLSCSTLEQLTLSNCYFHQLQRVNISAPNLWRLSIDVSWEERTCQVTIHARSLKDFHYCGVVRLSTPNALTEIDLWM